MRNVDEILKDIEELNAFDKQVIHNAVHDDMFGTSFITDRDVIDNYSCEDIIKLFGSSTILDKIRTRELIRELEWRKFTYDDIKELISDEIYNEIIKEDLSMDDVCMKFSNNELLNACFGENKSETD